MELVRHLVPLALLGSLALAGCGVGGPAPELPDGGTPAGGPDAAAAVTTVRVVTHRGAPVAGIDVVFHDPAGRAVATAVTGADGAAAASLAEGGGVTVLLDRGVLYTALALPAGATVRVAVEPPRSAPLEVTPRLPPIPTLPAEAAPASVGARLLCGPDTGAIWAPVGAPLPALVGDGGCLDPDGTYTVEAYVSSPRGYAYHTRRSGIPAGELSPELPAWRDDFPFVRRQLVEDSLWALGRPALRGPLFDETVLDRSASGRVAFAQTPGPAQGELVYPATWSADFGVRVQVHDVSPYEDGTLLDPEPLRPRGPRQLHVTAGIERAQIGWEDGPTGKPPRFALVALSWSSFDTGGALFFAPFGTWTVALPAGSRRLTYPEIPSRFARFLPPLTVQSPGVRFWAQVTYVDDDALASYGQLLAEGALDYLTPSYLPRRGADHVVTFAASSLTAPDDRSVKATGITLTSDPPASGGRVQIVAGEPLRLTATVHGVDDPRVAWRTQPSIDGPSSLEIDGERATLRVARPGRRVQLVAASAADPVTYAELLVEVLPPPCEQLLPPVTPPRPDESFVLGPQLPIAVRADGTPVVAAASRGPAGGEVAIDVLAWDGATWRALGGPVAAGAWPALSPGESPLALALDPFDRPTVAFAGDDTRVWRLRDGAWQPLPPIAAPLAGSMPLAIDAAGDPLVATAETVDGRTSVWLSRWKDGGWRRQRVHETDAPGVQVRAVAMDGELPLVAFDVEGYARIVRVDDRLVDLGVLDDDATFSAYPSPALAVGHRDQPIVAWLDRASGGVDAPTTIAVSQRTVGGWVALAPAQQLPGGDYRPHALGWSAADARTYLATPGSGAATVEVRDVEDAAAIVCRPVVDPFWSPLSDRVGTLGLAGDPRGGAVVAVGGPSITVERLLR